MELRRHFSPAARFVFAMCANELIKDAKVSGFNEKCVFITFAFFLRLKSIDLYFSHFVRENKYIFAACEHAFAVTKISSSSVLCAVFVGNILSLSFAAIVYTRECSMRGARNANNQSIKITSAAIFRGANTQFIFSFSPFA